MSESKSQRSARLKKEAAEEINRKYREGTLWVKEPKKGKR